MQESLTNKEAVVLKLLSEGDTMLCLDARFPGVHVPAQHAQNPNLHLVLNLNFPHPIDITAEGISANLAFGGRRFTCYLPMEALWAAFNPQTMQGTMWPDSIPPEVQAELAKQQGQPAPQATPAWPAAAPPAPRAIKNKETSEPDAPEKTSSPSGRQRGHLRLIK